ncbi:hypothetical protein AAFF_G00405710 [Aldrovandia affinis]|uniref:Uncharacterized protein n=1 Tax=Aldrovandia affinis TaxID=143900 RepID=A0AAD7SC03_9TELE|nr:hypothetical protein AAFF_G00405710 [Aldrovandia affinis]
MSELKRNLVPVPGCPSSVCSSGPTAAIAADIIISTTQTETYGACLSLFLSMLCSCCPALSCLFKAGAEAGEPAAERARGSVATSADSCGYWGSEWPDRHEEAYLEEENTSAEPHLVGKERTTVALRHQGSCDGKERPLD